MKWLCRIFGHKWEDVGSTIYTNVNFSKRHWKCKRCEEKDDDIVWHDL